MQRFCHSDHIFGTNKTPFNTLASSSHARENKIQWSLLIANTNFHTTFLSIVDFKTAHQQGDRGAVIVDCQRTKNTVGGLPFRWQSWIPIWYTEAALCGISRTNKIRTQVIAAPRRYIMCWILGVMAISGTFGHGHRNSMRCRQTCRGEI